MRRKTGLFLGIRVFGRGIKGRGVVRVDVKNSGLTKSQREKDRKRRVMKRYINISIGRGR